jgi:hypothetical protein
MTDISEELHRHHPSFISRVLTMMITRRRTPEDSLAVRTCNITAQQLDI